MIVFNELRIDSSKNLIIDASVLDTAEEGNSSLSIGDIKVGYGTNISSELINYGGETLDPEIFDRLDYDPITDNLRGFRLVINLLTDNNNEKLIYVWISENVPVEILATESCTIKHDIYGYVYDRCLLLNKVFDYLKQLDNPCEDVIDLANYIAKTQGIELAVEAGNFALANKYWNKFFNNSNTNGSTFNRGCGCHH